MYINIKKKHKGIPLKHERLRIGLSKDEADSLLWILASADIKYFGKDLADFGANFYNKLHLKWIDLNLKDSV